MAQDSRLQRIAQIFDEVNRTYFAGAIRAPRFLLSTRLTCTAGWVAYDDGWTMAISVPYHDHYDWEDELVDTIKHETIHLYLAYSYNRSCGHSKEFKQICQRIGASPWGKAMPRRRDHYRYHVVCPHCGRQVVRGSWHPELACSACCDTYNGGRFAPQFRFTLVKRVRMSADPGGGTAGGVAEAWGGTEDPDPATTAGQRLAEPLQLEFGL